MSRRFHSTIVDMIISVCIRLSKVCATRQVVLSGGVFLNEFILLNTVEGLHAAGLKPYFHHSVPTNDGGISLGQIVVARGNYRQNILMSGRSSMREYVNHFSAVLFDMDGVLIDSNSVIERGWREAAETFGKTISQDDIIKHIHGQPGPHTIRALLVTCLLKRREKFRHTLFMLRIQPNMILYRALLR